MTGQFPPLNKNLPQTIQIFFNLGNNLQLEKPTQNPKKSNLQYRFPRADFILTGEMDIESSKEASEYEKNGVDTVTNVKRAREGEYGGLVKKHNGDETNLVMLGPKGFGSALEMFNYFYNFLHYWPPNLDINKYEQMVVQDLLKKGHPEPEEKIGGGIQAFQIRVHPMWKSKCFFLIREDESVEDFSFKECVDCILPLPDNMRIIPDVNKVLGGSRRKGPGGRQGGRGGRGRGGRGHGRGR